MRKSCTRSSGEIQIDSRRTSSGRGPTLPMRMQVTIMNLLLLELPKAAAERATLGLAAARRLDNPHTLAHALALYCRYLSILGDVRSLHRAAEDLAVLAAEHRFPFYAAAADIYRGWVLAERDTPRGLAMMRDGTDAFVALGATGLRPWYLGRMQAQQREAATKGVVWLTVAASAPGEEGFVTAAEANDTVRKNNAAPTAVLLDPKSRIARAYGATVTPHMIRRFLRARDG